MQSILLLVPVVAVGITVAAAVAAGYVMISCSIARLKGGQCLQSMSDV